MYLRLGIPHTYSIHLRVLEEGKYRRLVFGNASSAESFDFFPPLPQRGDLVSYWIHRDPAEKAVSWMGRVDEIEFYYGGYDDEDPVQEPDVEAMVLITIYLTPLSEDERNRFEM
jgi:hypothetical protein